VRAAVGQAEKAGRIIEHLEDRRIALALFP